MIGMRVKMLFFDPSAVIGGMNARTRKVFGWFGGLVRKIARNSIRKRRRPSAPGSPPSSHSGLLKQFIFYAMDPAQRSVVIGPEKLNILHAQGSAANYSPVRGMVPEVLEYGGQMGIPEVFKWGKWGRADLRSRRRLAGLPMRVRWINMAARPYMRPAFALGLAKLPEMWRKADAEIGSSKTLRRTFHPAFGLTLREGPTSWIGPGLGGTMTAAA